MFYSVTAFHYHMTLLHISWTRCAYYYDMLLVRKLLMGTLASQVQQTTNA